MDKVALVGLAVSAKRRLDERFPEEEGSAVEQAEKRRGLAYALSRLKPIAGALQWKVPRAAIGEYLRELEHVRAVFSDDPEALALIRIQEKLCRYASSRPSGVHPNALRLLSRSLRALELLAVEPPGSGRRTRVARTILHEYAEFQSEIDPRGRDGGKRARPAADRGRPSAAAAGRRPAAPAPEARAYYLIPVNELDGLKAAIRRELDRLPERLLAALKRG
jgi:hypothetical protein